jgi:hypothetical protein
LLRLPCLLVVAALAVGSVPSGAIRAQESAPASVPKHAPKKKKSPSTAKPSMGAFGISNSLNAPSTDFSHVTKQDDDEQPGRRHDGPVVRPSIDSDGNPVMGLGF